MIGCVPRMCGLFILFIERHGLETEKAAQGRLLW